MRQRYLLTRLPENRALICGFDLARCFGKVIPDSLVGSGNHGGSFACRDEFAHLDSLEGVDDEKALPRLSAEQAQRHMKG